MMPQDLLSKQHLKDSVVAINQNLILREIFGDKECHLQMTNYRLWAFIREFYQVTYI